MRRENEKERDLLKKQCLEQELFSLPGFDEVKDTIFLGSLVDQSRGLFGRPEPFFDGCIEPDPKWSIGGFFMSKSFLRPDSFIIQGEHFNGT